MLQRQAMFKHLQERQQRQQLQEFGDARNQEYINQLLTLKQASGIQLAPIVNGAPVHDSQMIQHTGSSSFQGSPNGLVLSQSHNHALGPMALSMPQCDASLYGNMASNADKSSNLLPHLHGPYNHSAKMLTTNGNNVSGMSFVHPLGIDSSFVSHQRNYFPGQIGMPCDSLLTNQACQEKNSFGQVPVHSLNRDLLPTKYPQQGTSLQRSILFLESGERFGDTCSYETPPGQISKVSQQNDSLDPLEQKILYNTDDNSWVSSFGSRKIGTSSFDSTVENPSYIDSSPSIQSGSWSALMQSAAAETSSSDTAVQEVWSGLSFQNPEPSTDNQPLNFISTDILQNNWIDRNMQHVSSLCSDSVPLLQKSNKNYSFPEFKQSGLQILKQKDEFHSESSHVSCQFSPRNTSNLDEFHSESSHVSCQFSPRNTSNLVQALLPSSDTWPEQCHELRGPTWLHGSMPDSVLGGIQESFNQVNQMNAQRCSVESETMAVGNNVSHSSDLLGASSDVHGENLTVQSEIVLELLKKDAISKDHASGIQLNSKVSSLHELPLSDASADYFAKPCDNNPVSQGFGFKLGPVFAGTPDPHSFSPSLTMGSPGMPSLPSDYNQLQTPVKSSCLATKIDGYTFASSQGKFQLKSAGASGLEFPFLEKAAATQCQSSGTSDMSQGVQYQTGLPISFPDNITHGDVISPHPHKFSSDLLCSPDSVSANLENCSGSPNMQPNKNYLKHVHNLQEFGTYSGTSGYCEQKYQKEDSICEGWPHILIPESVSSSAHTVGSSRNHLEADGIVSGSMTAGTSQQSSNQVEQKDNGTPIVPPGGIRSSGHFLHQNLSSGNYEAVRRNSLQLKYDNISHQQSISIGREVGSDGQKLLLNDKAKYDPEALWPGTSPGNIKGWNFSQDTRGKQAGRAASASPQDFLQVEKLSQSGTHTTSIHINEASNATNQSQISLQMAPSWFKHYGTLKNGLMLPTHNPKAAQPFSGLSIGSVQGNSLIMPLNSDNANQGSGLWSSSSAALMVNKNLPTPTDATDQNLAVVKPKKRKLSAFDMLPWYREVHCDGSKLQSMSMAELEWSHVSNRRQEEARNDAEIVESVPPVVRSKRRLTFTTQLMQQVFRPAPASAFLTDARLNCDGLAYLAARLELGDACNLTAKSATNLHDVTDKLKTSKRSAKNFSKVAEGLISRVKKLEGNLSRLDRNLSLVDIKVESQDLEKFAMINRFAKFHIKATLSTVDPNSAAGQSALQKAIPQRDVTGFPMPRTLPEAVDCLSL